MAGSQGVLLHVAVAYKASRAVDSEQIKLGPVRFPSRDLDTAMSGRQSLKRGSARRKLIAEAKKILGFGGYVEDWDDDVCRHESGKYYLMVAVPGREDSPLYVPMHVHSNPNPVRIPSARRSSPPRDDLHDPVKVKGKLWHQRDSQELSFNADRGVVRRATSAKHHSEGDRIHLCRAVQGKRVKTVYWGEETDRADFIYSNYYFVLEEVVLPTGERFSYDGQGCKRVYPDAPVQEALQLFPDSAAS